MFMANPSETEIKPGDLWTGDLVPPLDNGQTEKPSAPAPTDPPLGDQGPMVDVYSLE